MGQRSTTGVDAERRDSHGGPFKTNRNWMIAAGETLGTCNSRILLYANDSACEPTRTGSINKVSINVLRHLLCRASTYTQHLRDLSSSTRGHTIFIVTQCVGRLCPQLAW